MTTSSSVSATERFVGVCHGNGTRKELSHVETMRFEIHNFANLEHKKGERFATPSIRAHGFPWIVKLYPRGTKNGPEDQVGICFGRERPDDDDVATTVEAKLELSVNNDARVLKYHDHLSRKDFVGYHDFASRKDFLANQLDRGTCVVMVKLQVMLDTKPLWRPPMPSFPSFMLHVKNSTKYSDVSFLVDGHTFHAHKVVLDYRARALLQLADASCGGPIEIPGVCPEIFQTFIDFVYMGDIPEVCADLGTALSLLEASDRFECTDLKLEVEAQIVEHFLDKSNAAKLHLFADSHTCALLTEASTELIQRHGAEIMNSPDWKLVEESAEVVSKLLRLLHGAVHTTESQFDQMDVSSLRKRLASEGIDVDGTRETLVRRCKKLREE